MSGRSSSFKSRVSLHVAGTERKREVKAGKGSRRKGWRGGQEPDHGSSKATTFTGVYGRWKADQGLSSVERHSRTRLLQNTHSGCCVMSMGIGQQKWSKEVHQGLLWSSHAHTDRLFSAVCVTKSNPTVPNSNTQELTYPFMLAPPQFH